MRLFMGTTDVPTATTRVALSTDAKLSATDRIVWARFSSREGNTGEVYVGNSDVSATDGIELEPEGTDLHKSVLEINPGAQGGTVPVGDIWFDADTNGNDVDWALLIDD